MRELERLRNEVAGPRKEAEADATQAKGMHHKARQERDADRRRRPQRNTVQTADRRDRGSAAAEERARLNRRATGFSDQRATERGRGGQLSQ